MVAVKLEVQVVEVDDEGDLTKVVLPVAKIPSVIAVTGVATRAGTNHQIKGKSNLFSYLCNCR